MEVIATFIETINGTYCTPTKLQDVITFLRKQEELGERDIRFVCFDIRKYNEEVCYQNYRVVNIPLREIGFIGIKYIEPDGLLKGFIRTKITNMGRYCRDGKY